MGLEVRKQERETSQNLIRRFTRIVQQSGVLLRARNVRFHKRTKSKDMRQKAALRRETLKKEYKKLEKLGLSKK